MGKLDLGAFYSPRKTWVHGGKAIRPKDPFIILKVCMGRVERDLGRHTLMASRSFPFSLELYIVGVSSII